VNCRIRFAVYGVAITLGGASGGVCGLSGAIAERIIDGWYGHIPVFFQADKIFDSDMLLSQAGLKTDQKVLFVKEEIPSLASKSLLISVE
jgi:hypothetical protein